MQYKHNTYTQKSLAEILRGIFALCQLIKATKDDLKKAEHAMLRMAEDIGHIMIKNSLKDIVMLYVILPLKTLKIL